MTTEEAIEKLGEAKGNVVAISLAKLALYSKISEKPAKNRHNFYCPVCNGDGRLVQVGRYDTRLRKMAYTNNYCHVCGQKIDWNEEESK